MNGTATLRGMCSLVACLACAGSVGQAAEPSPQATDQVVTRRLIFKQQPLRRLTVYYPDGWKPADRRPALVIFRCNIPVQREHFRQLGMVVIKPELAPVNHGRLPGLSLAEIAELPRPRHQVEDARSAIRFIRSHAAQLGIDPARIVATGTSGGGDLALQTFLNKEFEDPTDDRTVSSAPDALVLYCPAFDGIDIWYVKTEDLVAKTKAEAPAFLPLLPNFVASLREEYAVPADHRAELIKLAERLGAEQNIDEAEVRSFQTILELFNRSDWSLLHPPADALKMSATRILTDEPFPPTLILLGDRDHLKQPQTKFIAAARKRGKQFELKIFAGGGHSFMMQPPHREASTREVEQFLRRLKYLPTGSVEPDAGE